MRIDDIVKIMIIDYSDADVVSLRESRNMRFI